MSFPSMRAGSDIASANYNLEKMLQQPGGFEKVAMEKLPPFIREQRDYESFARSIVQSHPVEQKDIVLLDNEPYVYYAKDFDSHAAFYGEDGQIARLQIEGEGAYVGIMTVSTDDITISVKRLMVQKFPYLERVKDLSGQALAKLEDKKFINLVETLLLGNSKDAKNPEHSRQIVASPDTVLAKNHLIDLKQTISQHDLPVSSYVLNPVTHDDVLRWGRDEIDQLTQREMIETGNRYTFFGIKLIPSRTISRNVVYIFSDPEFVGRLPILKDVSVTLTDTPNKLIKGLFLYEFIGMYLASHKAIGKLVLNYESGVTELVTVDAVVESNAKDGEKPKDLGARA